MASAPLDCWSSLDWPIFDWWGVNFDWQDDFIVIPNNDSLIVDNITLIIHDKLNGYLLHFIYKIVLNIFVDIYWNGMYFDIDIDWNSNLLQSSIYIFFLKKKWCNIMWMKYDKMDILFAKYQWNKIIFVYLYIFIFIKMGVIKW